MILSVDDGCISDIRVAGLAKKYQVKTIFYIPLEWQSLAYDKGYEPLTYGQVLRIADEFEIGSHSVTHRHLTNISLDEAKREIFESKLMLEKLIGKEVTRFCPPRGYTNAELTDFTLEHYASQRLTKGKGLVHIHPNSGANNNLHWEDYAKTIDVKEVWLHSWELDRYDLWEQFERFLSEYRK